MMISTRGRYALCAMIDLAEHINDGYIPMKEVAQRHGLSLKYLERIMAVLSKSRLIDGLHGKSGGYHLNRSPENYTVGEILRIAEGNLTPISCTECGTDTCIRRDKCKTISMWNQFNNMTNGYFDSITIADLLEDKKGKRGL